MRNKNVVGSSYTEAKLRHLLYYRSTPCKYGHDGLRIYNGRCVTCNKASSLKIAKTPIKRAQSKMYERNKLRREQEALARRPRADKCEIPGCRTYGKVVYDHCHGTKKFRGWICERCNRVLGQVKDSPQLLVALAAYLAWGPIADSVKFTCEPIDDSKYLTRREEKRMRYTPGGTRCRHALG